MKPCHRNKATLNGFSHPERHSLKSVYNTKRSLSPEPTREGEKHVASFRKTYNVFQKKMLCLLKKDIASFKKTYSIFPKKMLCLFPGG